jgi:hypothetical protein
MILVVLHVHILVLVHLVDALQSAQDNFFSLRHVLRIVDEQSLIRQRVSFFVCDTFECAKLHAPVNGRKRDLAVEDPFATLLEHGVGGENVVPQAVNAFDADGESADGEARAGDLVEARSLSLEQGRGELGELCELIQQMLGLGAGFLDAVALLLVRADFGADLLGALRVGEVERCSFGFELVAERADGGVQGVMMIVVCLSGFGVEVAQLRREVGGAFGSDCEELERALTGVDGWEDEDLAGGRSYVVVSGVEA